MVKNNDEDEMDRLAEATNGRDHLNDPGMDDYETGWEEFKLGTRVEVRTTGNTWRKGTVVETPEENGYAIVVKCDEKWHDKLQFYGGRGATVDLRRKTRGEILSNIRKIDEIDEPHHELHELPISFKNSSSSKYNEI